MYQLNNSHKPSYTGKILRGLFSTDQSFLSGLLTNIKGTCSKKSLSVYDTWFGFYIHLKKGTFVLPYDHHRRKRVKHPTSIFFESVKGLFSQNVTDLTDLVENFFSITHGPLPLAELQK